MRLLSKSGRGRGVEVLRSVVARVAVGDEIAPAEPDRSPVRVTDREDDPLAESVVAPPRPLRAARREPHFGEFLGADVALRLEPPAHRVPAGRRPAELEPLDRLVGEATAAEVIERRLAGLRARQDDVVEGDRGLEDVAQTALPGVVAGAPLVELDAGPGGQDLEGLGEAHAVALHDEAEDVSAEAAAEALPALAGRRDDEARRLLAVERAEALERRARLLQLDRLPDHIGDLEPALHFRGDTDGH